MEDDKVWIRQVSSRLHEEDREIRWDVETYTAEDVIGGIPDHRGEIYLSSGICFGRQHLERVCHPFLYLPCFDEGEDFSKTGR